MRSVIPLPGIVAFWVFLLPGVLFGQAPEGKESARLDLLVVAPHPDDEAIGCAAVMMRAVQKQQRVGVVLVTNGDGYPQAAGLPAVLCRARRNAGCRFRAGTAVR